MKEQRPRESADRTYYDANFVKGFGEEWNRDWRGDSASAPPALKTPAVLPFFFDQDTRRAGSL
jgi:hypothetical protein